jgi:hypothetical protein
MQRDPVRNTPKERERDDAGFTWNRICSSRGREDGVSNEERFLRWPVKECRAGEVASCYDGGDSRVLTIQVDGSVCVRKIADVCSGGVGAFEPCFVGGADIDWTLECARPVCPG